MITLSQKDINLITNAVGQMWPRTERYRHVLALMREVDEGPRGKWWFPCNTCGERFRQADINLDHINPVVPLDKQQKDMTLIEYVERKFLCPIQNFQILCISCHFWKTQGEKATRMERERNRDLIK